MHGQSKVLGLLEWRGLLTVHVAALCEGTTSTASSVGRVFRVGGWGVLEDGEHSFLEHFAHILTHLPDQISLKEIEWDVRPKQHFTASMPRVR